MKKGKQPLSAEGKFKNVTTIQCKTKGMNSIAAACVSFHTVTLQKSRINPMHVKAKYPFKIIFTLVKGKGTCINTIRVHNTVKVFKVTQNLSKITTHF